MATIQRYVNTASVGGDGTTNGTAGATAAFASLSSAEANISPTGADDVIIDCCGTAADSTAVTVDFATTPASTLIQGNRSDGAGFYNGTSTISTSHYRLTSGASTNTLTISEPGVTIDGIQIIGSGGAAFSCLRPHTAVSGTIKNCRVLASGVDYCIGRGTSWLQGGTHTFENNVLVGYSVDGFGIRVDTNFSPTVNLYHNTIYGDGSSTGIRLVQANGAGAPTYNIKGNAVANNGTGNDYDASAMVEDGATVNLGDNAFSEAAGTSGEIVLGVTTDAWTSPGTSEAAVFTVKNTSSSLYNAVNPTLLSTDITAATRDGTNHDVGAFELEITGDEQEAIIGSASTGAQTAPGVNSSVPL
jgi:hypothetical protein